MSAPFVVLLSLMHTTDEGRELIAYRQCPCFQARSRQAFSRVESKMMPLEFAASAAKQPNGRWKFTLS